MRDRDQSSHDCVGNVLVVDDLPNWREVLAEALAKDGHTVLTAEKPSQALEIITCRPVDVTILDLRLEDRDLYNVQGVRLLQQIRMISPHTRIIMITGFPSAGLLDKVPSVYDVDALWLKNPVDQPFDINEFRWEIRQLVAKARINDVLR